MHIFVFGNLNVGKSTFCKTLLSKLPDYDYLSLDRYRQEYSDGSLKGEKLACREFVSEVTNTSNAIVEFTGCGPVAEQLQTALNSKCGVLIAVNRCLAENIASLDETRFASIPYPIEYRKRQTVEETIQQLEKSTALPELESSWRHQVWQSYSYKFEQGFESFWAQFPFAHHGLMERLNRFVLTQNRISAALIYGSFGANHAGIDSDIDYFIQSDLPPPYWYDALLEHFKNDVVHTDLLNNKITLRCDTGVLVEIVVGKQWSEITLYYRESLIHNCDFTLVKGNAEKRLQLSHFLANQKPTSSSAASIASETYFLFCSLPKLVKSEDSYKYSFHTMIIRHYAIQLEHLLLGQPAHNYLPKQAVLALPHFPWDSFNTSATTIDSSQYLALYRYLEGLFRRLENAQLIEVNKYFSTRTEFLHHLA